MQLFFKRRDVLIFFLVFAIAACQRVQSYNKRLAPLPQDSFVKVYFNHSESSEYKESYRQQTRLGDDLEKQIVDAISQAQSTVDVAVQELRLPKVALQLMLQSKSYVYPKLLKHSQTNKKPELKSG